MCVSTGDGSPNEPRRRLIVSALELTYQICSCIHRLPTRSQAAQAQISVVRPAPIEKGPPSSFGGPLRDHETAPRLHTPSARERIADRERRTVDEFKNRANRSVGIPSQEQIGMVAGLHCASHRALAMIDAPVVRVRIPSLAQPLKEAVLGIGNESFCHRLLQQSSVRFVCLGSGASSVRAESSFSTHT